MTASVQDSDDHDDVRVVPVKDAVRKALQSSASRFAYEHAIALRRLPQAVDGG
jgi:hypothetical protein